MYIILYQAQDWTSQAAEAKPLPRTAKYEPLKPPHHTASRNPNEELLPFAGQMQ